mmetsp:Transcript_97998/g.277412  ORF Transcript_97998/g.277412 Transcript_97998/m.277412 type:complete len:221 (+) Transcript_97998:2291-2953(+)
MFRRPRSSLRLWRGGWGSALPVQGGMSVAWGSRTKLRTCLSADSACAPRSSRASGSSCRRAVSSLACASCARLLIFGALAEETASMKVSMPTSTSCCELVLDLGQQDGSLNRISSNTMAMADRPEVHLASSPYPRNACAPHHSSDSSQRSCRISRASVASGSSTASARRVETSARAQAARPPLQLRAPPHEEDPAPVLGVGLDDSTETSSKGLSSKSPPA